MQSTNQERENEGWNSKEEYNRPGTTKTAKNTADNRKSQMTIIKIMTDDRSSSNCRSWPRNDNNSTVVCLEH